MTAIRDQSQAPRDDHRSDLPVVATTRGVERRLLAVAAGLFVISRIIMLVSPWPGLSDANLYCDYALCGVDFGQVAYRDFTIEYPPLAWGLIALPRLLATERRSTETPAEALADCRNDYRRTFRGLMFACDLAALGLVWAIARRRCPARQGSVCLAYVVTTTSSSYLLYDRLDLGLLLLLLLWAMAWLRSIDDRESAGAWRLGSYAVLGLSVAYKLIPILVLPYLLLTDWQARPRRRIWLRITGVYGRAGHSVPGALPKCRLDDVASGRLPPPARHSGRIGLRHLAHGFVVAGRRRQGGLYPRRRRSGQRLGHQP